MIEKLENKLEEFEEEMLEEEDIDVNTQILNKHRLTEEGKKIIKITTYINGEIYGFESRIYLKDENLINIQMRKNRNRVKAMIDRNKETS